MANTTNYNMPKPDTLTNIGGWMTDWANNLDTIDAALHKHEVTHFKWREVHTVAQGANTITLTNPYVAGDVLIVKETKYGTSWFSPTHFSISGSTLTFTSAMAEELTFEILNLDQGVV